MARADPTSESSHVDDAERARLDEAVARAGEAARAFRRLDQREVDEIVWRMTRAGLLAATDLARHAVEETGIGVFEDKVFKNLIATEFLYDHLRGRRTVGTIREDRARALRWVAEPIGTVLAIAPLTNPTSTALFKAIVAAKTRNALLLRPSSRALGCSTATVELLAAAGEEAGMPAGALQCLAAPSRPGTRYLFGHDGIDFVWTTGGQAVVRAANASGKPTIGVGPGNAPVYLHASADVPMAVVDVLASKTFDASTICPAEQAIVVDREIADGARAEFERMGARFLQREEVERLLDLCFDRATGELNVFAIGQPVAMLAEAAGIEVEAGCRAFVAPVRELDGSDLLLHEKLFPLLAWHEVGSVEEALDACDAIVSLGGLGHTSAVYARDRAVVDAFGERIRTGRILVNAPTAIGALGGTYTDLSPTFSLGCGTWGGTTTTANVNVDELMNVKLVSERKHPPMWFRAPVDVYFNAHAIDNLRAIPATRAAIVTSPGCVDRGQVEQVVERLATARVDVFDEVGPEPGHDTLEAATRFLQRADADVIVALGGGSVLDLAKLARLRWAHPEAVLEDLALPFLDVRKRVAEYPERPEGHQLVAIPTTSGTGSEVSPAAVLTAQDGRKVALVDYTLVPEVAIVDPHMAMSQPPALTADSGVDALTHAVESLVSVFASPYTHALSLRAIHDLQAALPLAWRDGDDLEARQRVHNAATIAGLAFSNAFLGVAHSLAHALGSTFDVPHGRACGIFLPHVVRYNAEEAPTRTTPSPSAKYYVAPQQLAQAARALGLGSARERPEDGIARFDEAVVELLSAVGQPRSIAELGITEDDFRRELPRMVQLAFADPSGRTNPRMPMEAELEGLLEAAWRGW